MSCRWLPLESNPEVITKYVKNLGVKGDFAFSDVLSLDDELLCMVPQPAYALLLLFPSNEKHKKFRDEENARIEKEGQEVSQNVYFIKQTIGNACGTIAIIHALANNTENLHLESDGYIDKFVKSTKNLTPAEKADKLETDEGITQAHESSAQEGQTETPSVDDEVKLHFIAIVQKDGHLYELDGTKQAPINHGKSSPDSFLQDAVKVCREFMARDPEEVHFSVVALSGSS